MYCRPQVHENLKTVVFGVHPYYEMIGNYNEIKREKIVNSRWGSNSITRLRPRPSYDTRIILNLVIKT